MPLPHVLSFAISPGLQTAVELQRKNLLYTWFAHLDRFHIVKLQTDMTTQCREVEATPHSRRWETPFCVSFCVVPPTCTLSWNSVGWSGAAETELQHVACDLLIFTAQNWPQFQTDTTGPDLFITAWFRAFHWMFIVLWCVDKANVPLPQPRTQAFSPQRLSLAVLTQGKGW